MEGKEDEMKNKRLRSMQSVIVSESTDESKLLFLPYEKSSVSYRPNTQTLSCQMSQLT